MHEEHGYIKAGDEQLHYLKMGAGKRLLLAFHGYSNNAGMFGLFEPYLHNEFTIISFDLPYHGQSAWKGAALGISDLGIVLCALMSEYNVEQVSLMGYSLGGRVCLTIAEHWPGSIDKIILLSADGLVFDPFYFFTTRTYLGKRMFGHLVATPQAYIRILAVLKRYKLISNSLHSFIISHLVHRQSREFLQQVWQAMRYIRPHLYKTKGMLNKYSIPVIIFMGEYDRIIPVGNGVRFRKGLDTARLYILPCGHRTITPETLPEIVKSLIGS